MRQRLQTGQWVPYPVDQVFSFFANPENLPFLMPRWQKARIEEASFVSPPPRPQAQSVSRHMQSFAAGAGSRITISFRPFPYSPIRASWEAYIAEFTWNESFYDEQLRGPFAYWLHCHRMAAEERGGVAGTRVTDDVTYEMRLGAVGGIANALLVRRQMKKMFGFRQKRLEYLLRMRKADSLAGMTDRKTK